MSDQCEQLRARFAEVKRLHANFIVEYEQADKTGDYTKLRVLKDELEEKLSELEKHPVLQWGQFDRRTMRTVEKKKNYRVVETIGGDLGPVRTLQVLPDGRIVAGRNGKITIHTKSESGEWEPESLPAHVNSVFTLQALPDGRIVSGGDDKHIIIHTKSNSGEWSKKLLPGHADIVAALHVLSDDRMVSGGLDKRIISWFKSESGEWEQEIVVIQNNVPRSLQALPDGRIVCADYKDIFIWSKRSGKWGAVGWRYKVPETNTYNYDVHALQALPDGRIVLGRRDGKVIILSNSDEGWVEELIGSHAFSVNTLQVLPDGRVVSASDFEIIIWSKAPFGRWEQEVLAVNTNSLQVLPDGRIVSGGEDGSIYIWDGDKV